MSENRILKDLDRGVRPAETLQRFTDILTAGYMKLAYCRLAVNFSSYYDDLEKAGGPDADKTKDDFENLLTLIEKDLLSQDHTSPETDRQKLDGMRNALTARMQCLYDYVHILGIYEHVMNRIQYQYEDEVRPVDLEGLMTEIHQFICRDQEPSGMNTRLQDVFGEMPVRMTRSRFMDMVQKGCSYYMGTRSDIADHFFDEMYHQAVLPRSTELNPAYEDLYDIVCDMEALDFEQMNAEKVKAALDKLQIASQQLGQAFSYDFQLLELMNDLYILLLNMPFAGTDKEVAPLACGCISAYMKAAREHDFIGMDEDILSDITRLNAYQEKLVGMHVLFEDQLAGTARRYAAEIAECGLTDLVRSLKLSNILSGIDLMAKLDADREIFVTDRDYIMEKTDKLLSMYRDIFHDHPMNIRRAVIADALTKLPLACDSLEEGEMFIRQNFENCRDQAELYASAKLIRTIMADSEW